METTNIIINVSISVVAGGAAGFGIFKLLGRSWVQNWFEKDLKKYEHQLDMLKMQKSLKYSNVYTKQAEIIADIYNDISRIAVTERMLQGRIFKDEAELQEQLDSYADFISNANIYAVSKGIYLNTETRNKVISLYDQITKDILKNMKDVSERLNKRSLQEIESIPEIDKKQVLEELIVDFQNILGINEK